MKISVAKSDYFMERARECCLLRAEGSEHDYTYHTKGNYFSSRFLDAYIMSATALEAFINERIAINLEICKGRLAYSRNNNRISSDEDKNREKVLEMLKDQDLQTKYRMMPIILWNKAYDEGKYPFQDFIWLVAIRNDIIHYKMPFYDEQDKRPKWVNKLEEKGIFLLEPVVHPPEPIPDEGRRVWIDEICTLKGAKWAYNTSCAMIKQFVELSEGMTKITCQPWADSLIEI